jgi:hypothetical protein
MLDGSLQAYMTFKGLEAKRTHLQPWDKNITPHLFRGRQQGFVFILSTRCIGLHSHLVICQSLGIRHTERIETFSTSTRYLSAIYSYPCTCQFRRERFYDGPALPTFLRCQIADRAIDLIFPCLWTSNHRSPPQREALSWVPNKLLNAA